VGPQMAAENQKNIYSRSQNHSDGESQGQSVVRAALLAQCCRTSTSTSTSKSESPRIPNLKVRKFCTCVRTYVRTMNAMQCSHEGTMLLPGKQAKFQSIVPLELCFPMDCLLTIKQSSEASPCLSGHTHFLSSSHFSSSFKFHKNFLLEGCCCPLKSLTSSLRQSALTQRCCAKLGSIAAPRSSLPRCEAKVFQQPFCRSMRADEAHLFAATYVSSGSPTALTLAPQL